MREVMDDRRLPKAERKLLQVEHAAHLTLKARAGPMAIKGIAECKLVLFRLSETGD